MNVQQKIRDCNTRLSNFKDTLDSVARSYTAQKLEEKRKDDEFADLQTRYAKLLVLVR